MPKMKLSYPFICAVVLHILLLSMIFLTFKSNTQIGKPLVFMRCYVYNFSNQQIKSEQTINKQSVQKNLAASATKTPINNTTMIHVQSSLPNNKKSFASKTINTKQQTKEAKKSTTQQAENNTTGDNNTLLEALHNAIAKAQYYPQMALLLKQHGQVQVQFTLAPDGTISNISIFQSSGFNLLDQAAINAVKNISPFKPANFYLKNNKVLNISLIFNIANSTA